MVKALDISINSQYNGIISLKDTIENLKESIENTKTTVKHDQLRYDLELIAEIELIKSESALKDLENTLNTTIVSLNSQYLTLTQYSYTPEKQ
jgi:outer membrane protein TolC